MLTKTARLQAEENIIAYNKKYFKKIELDKRFQKLVTFSPSKKIGIYNWFPYKEAFSKELVYKLIDIFKLKEGNYILDPFCGIGTALLAAKERNINAVGVDIMPLSVFITKVKMNINHYNTKIIKSYLNKILDSKLSINSDLDVPNIRIIDRAFRKKEDFLKILSIRELIKDKVKKSIYQDIFILGLLSTVEKISLTKKDGAFLRIVEKDNNHSILDLFQEQIEKYIFDIDNYNKNLFEDNKNKVYYKVYCDDSRSIKLEDKFHAVITSPPYLNRYDYTRTYALELAIHFVKNFDELKKIRYNTIRSHVEAKYKKTDLVKSVLLKQCLQDLEKVKLNNPKIPEMIKGYFEDMYLVIKNIKKYCYKGANIGFVVGNVRYSGVSIPVDEILFDIGGQLGLNQKKIVVTRIKGNSQQQRKLYGENPNRESIVILSL